MRWDDADGLTGRPDARVRGVLESWRAGLLDLTAANPLIHADPWAPGMVAIDSPSPRGVLEALQQGRECGFLGTEEQEEGPRPRTANVFQTPMPDAELDATLRALRRADHRDLLEYGLSALYLTLGTLHWNDDQQEYASPILLVPVDLVDSDPLDYPRLRARPDDPLVNPALAVRLRAHGVELPAVEGLSGLDVTVFWARLDAALGDYPQWRTDEAILLSRFTVHREVVYQDLVDNERQILAHPVVRALATEARSQIDAFKFEPVSARRIDDVASPDDIPLVLDADAAQRSCIAAALAGRSFVMRGAPGTGKSQTVANMIAALIHAGKRVLLVSEKAASLDVVKDRLTHAGLDDYLLELHSDRTGRDHVAAALAAALDFIPLPPPSLSTDERQELREHRERLNAYAEAMNEVREPLGHRLHDVLGMCAQMTDVPAAPVPPVLPIPLTTQSLQKVRDAAERLGRAWRPAVQGDAFLWRDVADRNRLDARLHQALTALEHLVEAAGADQLAAAFQARNLSDAITLTTLIGHAARRPPEAADEWLTLDSLEPVARAAEGLLGHLKSLHQAEDAVRARAGVTWSALPTPGKLPVVPSLVHLDPPAVELLPLTAAQARGLARRFSDDADRLEQHQHSLDRVTARLGLPNVVAFSDIGRVVAIVDLLSRADKPEAGWFDAAGMAAAHTAARLLQRAVEVVRAAEEKAREHFNEGALAHPVDELADRFASVHRGLRKLRAPYRRDKKAAAEIARPDVKRKQAVANLAAAAAWKKALTELDEAEREYARTLGRHWRRMDTDFEAIRRALGTAEEVLRVTPPEALPAVIERVSAATPNSAIIRIVSEAHKEFDRWTAALRPPPEPAPRPQLAAGPVHDAVTWLRAHVEPLTATAELVQAYSAAAGRDFTLAEAAAIGLLRESAADAAAALSANAADHAKVLGTVYRGTQTDVEALTTAMAWTSEARRIRVGIDTALTAEQVVALGRSRPTDPLPSRVAEWQAARDWILRAFAPRRHAQLTTALDDYEQARHLIRALLEDGKGQQEWFDYQAARTVLADHGLDAAVDFCAREDLGVDQILPVLGRALFQSWADTVIREDDRLPPLDSPARDRLVEEFRTWDARLQRAACADVMNAVDRRQPSGTAAAEAALLRACAAQTGRKLPVSELIGRTRHATLAVKPCFLTVPADVSRLVPADLTFDVVIIDEASRLSVPDAITCIYRGASVVVVGDDRQLTALPTPGDGRSVLDLAIGCAAFPVLDLTTHYRSRHESLIAFANHTFYQGTLTTFPPAGPTGPDTGVQLFQAAAENGDDGLAGLVAGRVAHHFVTRPELSLGVIACTPELAMRIEVAVADMVVPPDDDRLRGFFVKDLGTVQGDERDVILLAIGADLGGLAGPDGWRGLNVATTRAARRIEVISTVRGRDLPDAEELRPLVAYLDYATRGESALGLDDTRPEAQTPFEDSVRDVIRSWGYRVRTRVGTGAFRIDLAVRRSARRDAPFALGIECDGTSYDSAPAARDRDRLREQVLEELGWKLHRIWGTAWYLDREHEELRLRTAIEEALAEFPPEERAAELEVSTIPEGQQREPVTLVQTEDGYAAVGPVESFEPVPEDVVPVDSLAELDDEVDAYLSGIKDVAGHLTEETAAPDEPATPEQPVAGVAPGPGEPAEPVAGVAPGPGDPAEPVADVAPGTTRPAAGPVLVPTEAGTGAGVPAAIFERVTRVGTVEDLGAQEAPPRVAAAGFERAARSEEADEPRVVPATFERLSRADVAGADVARADVADAEAARVAQAVAAVEGLPVAQPVFVAPEFTPAPNATLAPSAGPSSPIDSAAGPAHSARAVEPGAPTASAAPAAGPVPVAAPVPVTAVAPAPAPSTEPAQAPAVAKRSRPKKATKPVAPAAGPQEWAHPYRKAKLAALPDGAGLASPDTARRVADAIRRIAAVEGPVHISIALQRLRDEWALARITKPARTAIDATIEKLAAKGDITWSDDFLGDPGQLVPTVRLRSEGVARKADQIADAELRVAIEHLVTDAGAIDADNLLAAVGKLFGWAARRSPELDNRLTTLITGLVSEGRLEQRADGLSVAPDLPDPLSLPRHDTATAPARKVGT